MRNGDVCSSSSNGSDPVSNWIVKGRGSESEVGRGKAVKEGRSRECGEESLCRHGLVCVNAVTEVVDSVSLVEVGEGQRMRGGHD